MDFDREYDLENAGIDAFEFSLMDDDERAEALRDAGLDPDDYEGIELDSSFHAWSVLQENGIDLWELDLMEEEEKREVLENAGLDPDEFGVLPTISVPGSTHSPASTDQKNDVSETQSGDQASAPHQESPVLYQLCGVVFPGSNQRYSYLINGLDLDAGDAVVVPVGPSHGEAIAKVVSLGAYTAETAPYPIEKTKSVIRKATASESEAFTAEKVQYTSPQSTWQNNQTETAVREKRNTNKKATKAAWWFCAVSVAALILVTVGQKNGSTSSNSTYSSYGSPRYTQDSYSYSGSKSSIPPCPPVNRERAMTKEEAERLSGTGYHGTRPNSSAELAELNAEQVRCKNCGYRSHNGINSLCDYCAWMERYGGGLPTAKAPDVTPRPTPRPTPRQTAKPRSSDAYHASDYAHPDDFYYDYYDDFADYEEAEDYWEKHH